MFFFFFFFLIFTYGRTGSWLLHAGFLLLRPMGLVFLTVCRLLVAMASLVAGHRFSAHGLQYLWCTGLAAPCHVGSSWTRDGIGVPWISRCILNLWNIGEVWCVLEHGIFSCSVVCTFPVGVFSVRTAGRITALCYGNTLHFPLHLLCTSLTTPRMAPGALFLLSGRGATSSAGAFNQSSLAGGSWVAEDGLTPFCLGPRPCS